MNITFSKEDQKSCIPYMQQIVDFYFTALNEGVLALEEKATQPDVDPLIKLAVDLIVYGVDPKMVTDVLKYILELSSKQSETHEILKTKIIVEGMLSIQAGEHISIIEEKMAAFGMDCNAKVLNYGVAKW